MHDLQVNDEVMVGENTFSKVVSFLHRIEHIDAEFIRIHYEPLQGVNPRTTTTGNYITITPKHLIETRNGESTSFSYIPAFEVKPNDLLKYHDRIDGNMEYVRVTRVESVRRDESGIYAPLTESGTLIVDRIHVSCFSMVKSHRLAELVYKAANWLMDVTSAKRVYSSDELFDGFTHALWTLAQTLGVSSVFLNL